MQAQEEGKMIIIVIRGIGGKRLIAILKINKSNLKFKFKVNNGFPGAKL